MEVAVSNLVVGDVVFVKYGKLDHSFVKSACHCALFQVMSSLSMES